MKKRKVRFLFVLILVSLLTLALGACGPDSVEPTPVPQETSAVPVTATETAPAPEAPTAVMPSVVLSVSPNADSGVATQVQTTLATLAEEANLTLIVQEVQNTGEIPAEAQVVVGVGPGADFTALAAAAPAVQFVAIDQPGVAPGANLSVIGDPVEEAKRQAFMGGYLSALVSTDHKVAGLLASDAAATDETVNAYVIGARFFCGLCNPKYPPYTSFPKWETLPVGSAPNAYQPVVDGLVAAGVEVIYVDPLLVASDLLTYLADSGLKVVGGASPDTVRSNWVGTVAPDPAAALVALWPKALFGQGGIQMPVSVTLKDRESGLLSEGRLRVFEETVADLEAGIISTEFTP